MQLKSQRKRIYSVHIAATQRLSLLFSFATHTSGGKIDFQFFSSTETSNGKKHFLTKEFLDLFIYLTICQNYKSDTMYGILICPLFFSRHFFSLHGIRPSCMEIVCRTLLYENGLIKKNFSHIIVLIYATDNKEPTYIYFTYNCLSVELVSASCTCSAQHETVSGSVADYLFSSLVLMNTTHYCTCV